MNAKRTINIKKETYLKIRLISLIKRKRVYSLIEEALLDLIKKYEEKGLKK